MTGAKWQMPGRISRWVAGTLGMVFLAVTMAYVAKLARPEKPTPVPQNIPQNIDQQLSGYTFTRSEGKHQIFTVRAARTVAFKDGEKTLLEDVTVEVYGRASTRHDVLKTQRCDYEPKTGGLSCLGKVEIELNANSGSPVTSGFKGRQPLYLETSKIDYEPRMSLVRSDAPTRFRYGPASGSAVGIRYDTRDGWVELTKDVVINLPSFGNINAPLRIASAGLSLKKEAGQVELQGPLEITQGSRRVVAGQGKILLDQASRITQGILENGAQGSDTSKGSPLAVRAATVKADFDPASSELRTLVADGNVSVESRRGGNGGEASAASLNQLFAQHVEVSFTSGASRSPRPLHALAVGNVQFRLESPSRGGTGGRSQGGTGGTGKRESGEKLSAELRPFSAFPLSPFSPEMIPHPREKASHATGERDQLTASEVQFEFDPTGPNLREAKTIGPGELVILPSDPKEGKRVITAGQFLMAFDGRNHLERLRGLSRTKVVMEPAADKPSGVPSETWSDELNAQLDTTTQELVTLEQAGHFQFREGERQAKADRAYYIAQDQVLRLTGGPLLWDPETRIRAGQVRINLRTGTAEGFDGVESTHFGRTGTALLAASSPAVHEAQGRSGQSPHSADPALGSAARQEEAATNVLADRVRAQRDSQFLHYEGHVRAWSGNDVVESPSLDIYRKQQRIVSGSGVVTSHVLPSSARSASPAPASGAIGGGLGGGGVPLTIHAERLEYLNEGHEGRYTGHVEVETGSTRLKADRVDVYFSSLPAESEKPAAGAQIERVVARGHVTVTQPARYATGEEAEYFAGQGKVVMTGGPPACYDEQNGFTTGRSLTFFIRDDSLLVEGGDQSPTVSKRRLAR
jgi:lipopolysaccharide transport protein LptA